MPAAINLPQISTATQATSSGSAAENQAPDSASTVPFAQVLKERSARPEATSAAKAAGDEASTSNADGSATSAALAPQFLALLQGSAAVADDAAKTALPADSKGGTDLIADAVTQNAAEAQAPMLLAALPVSLPATAATETSATPATVSSSGHASRTPSNPVAPDLAAQDSVPNPVPSRGDLPAATETNANGQRATRSDPAASRNGEVKLAAEPAKTAEPAKIATATEPKVAATEFKPLLERLAGSRADGVALAPAALQPNTQVPNAANTPALPVTTPVGHPAWAEDVGQRISWMVGQNRQEADLVLNPPQLGRIEVTIVVQGDQVNASFSSPHQAVREALESSLTRLRDGLAESGISLGQTHVGRDSSRDAPFARSEGQPGRPRDIEVAGTGATAPRPDASAWHARHGRSMVDVFA